jgi:TatD DNase family protein
MKLVDVHCHLNHKVFEGKIDQIIINAKQNNVKAILVSGVNSKSNREVLELVKKDDLLKASLGIYPIDALGLAEGETGLPRQPEKIDLDEEFKFIEKNKDKIVAIGEIGMDFHWDKDHHQEQENNFRKIIQFANKICKPIIIHTRNAEKECLDVLEQESKVKVCLHSFSGNKKLIKRAIELGYYFSVPPKIMLLEQFQMLVSMVPLTQLLTETDAPWMSPERDLFNEPANVLVTIKKIAEIKNLTIEEIADQVWKNYSSFIIP